VRSHVIVISGIGFQDAAQVRLAQHDDMVHALAPDQSFGKAVLPRRTWRDGFVTDAHGSQSARRSAVDLIAITDQVARSLIPRKCLRDLAGNPFRGGMKRGIDPDKLSDGPAGR